MQNDPAKMASFMGTLLIILLVLILVIIGMSIYQYTQGTFKNESLGAIAILISSLGITYLNYRRHKNLADKTSKK